jgi:hypothetical protein
VIPAQDGTHCGASSRAVAGRGRLTGCFLWATGLWATVEFANVLFSRLCRKRNNLRPREFLGLSRGTGVPADLYANTRARFVPPTLGCSGDGISCTGAPLTSSRHGRLIAAIRSYGMPDHRQGGHRFRIATPPASEIARRRPRSRHCGDCTRRGSIYTGRLTTVPTSSRPSPLVVSDLCRTRSVHPANPSSRAPQLQQHSIELRCGCDDQRTLAALDHIKAREERVINRPSDDALGLGEPTRKSSRDGVL